MWGIGVGGEAGMRRCCAACVAVLLAGVATAQQPQIAWVAKTPTLRPLKVAVGGRSVARGAGERLGATTHFYQWPGTHFDAAFAGPEVYLRLGEENEQILHVVVDHLPPLVLMKPKTGDYRVAGLGAGPHTIRVELVTENQAALSEFLGFAVPVYERPRMPPTRTRQMELIGDSYTVGYGNGSSKVVCTPQEVLLATDVDRTAGVMAAVHVDADYRVVAISGRGLVRNFDGGAGDTVPAAYPFVLENRLYPYMEERGWQPQVVVVSLGTNDFTTPLRAGEPWKSREALHRDFEASYVRFVQGLRKRYPGTYFLLWATDQLHGEIVAEVSKVVTQLNAGGESRVQFIPMHDLSMSACDRHPSRGDNKLIYDRLVGFLDAHPQIWQGK